MVEFYNLGIGEYYPISSISGSGTGDLLDELILNIFRINLKMKISIFQNLQLLEDLMLGNLLL